MSVSPLILDAPVYTVRTGKCDISSRSEDLSDSHTSFEVAVSEIVLQLFALEKPYAALEKIYAALGKLCAASHRVHSALAPQFQESACKTVRLHESTLVQSLQDPPLSRYLRTIAPVHISAIL